MTTAISVDVGGTRLKAGIVQVRMRRTGGRRQVTEARVLSFTSADTPRRGGRKRLFEVIAECVLQVVGRAARRGADRPVAIGVGVPGPVDVERGFCFTGANLPALTRCDVAGELRTALQVRDAGLAGLPIKADNDANMATLGELRVGGGRRARNLLLLTLGTGIGGGIAVNDEVWRGAHWAAGEIGHMVVQKEGGAACGCGNHGCFETVAAERGILRRTRERLRAGEPSVLRERFGADMDGAEAGDVIDAAKDGDEMAQAVVRETGEWIGVGIASAVVLLDPELVLIGGGIARAGKMLFEPIRKTLAQRAPISRMPPSRVQRARLGYRAGTVGAAVLAVEAGL